MTTSFCFSLPGIRCANCVRPIEKAFYDCKTVHIDHFSVELVDKKLTVLVANETCSPSEIRRLLHEVLDNLGVKYADILSPAELPPLASENGGLQSPSLPSSLKPRSFSLRLLFRSHWFLGILGTFSGIAILLLSLTAGALPLLAKIAIASISLPLTLLIGAESYTEAVKALFKTRALTMDTLFTISTITVLIVSMAAFYFPWLPMMFDTGLMIFGFRHIGFGIEESIKRAIGLGLTFKDREPKFVECLNNEPAIRKSLDSVELNDLLLIQPGQIIPVDGVCEMEGGIITEMIVTGQPFPRAVTQGGRLLAGMYVAKGSVPLRLRVTAEAKQSYLARLDATIARANLEKAPLEAATNKILQYFIPTVLVVAVVSALVVGHFFSLALAIQCAVSVLVSACPCTLGFITPIAVKIGMNKAAENGVRFKSAKTLQEADQIDRVVFDLNGTLTEGIPNVKGYGIADGTGVTPSDLLAYFACLEKDSSHPFAQAIYKYAEGKVHSSVDGWVLRRDAQSNHSGVSATINQEAFAVGNQSMMDDLGIDTRAITDRIPVEGGDTVIYLARQRQIIGYMIVADRLRPHARNVVQTLMSMGKEVYLCTGADKGTAQHYANQLGIPPINIRASYMGVAARDADANKKAFIEDLKTGGHRVAFVGDGPNDAAVIAASHFGMAVQSHGGDEMTQEQAGAIIQSGSLMPIVNAFSVAKQTVSHIKQNLLMSLGYNSLTMLIAGGLLLSIGITLNPGVGVALMILQTSLMLFNAYRFKQQKLAVLASGGAILDPDENSYRRCGSHLLRPAPLLQFQSKPPVKCDLSSQPEGGERTKTRQAERSTSVPHSISLGLSH